jgi:2'-5' RNA ligase
MPRLFVALDLPQAARQKLSAHQPQSLSGIRLIRSDQMHLTLHFIGEAEVPPIAEALSYIKYPAFNITIEGAGKFRTAGGVVLWAGVNRNPALSGLHVEVGKRISTVGIAPEARPYQPHVTLARCRRDIPGKLLDSYLEEQRQLRIADIGITTFSLYSSSLSQQGPIYRQESCYPLASMGHTGDAVSA